MLMRTEKDDSVNALIRKLLRLLNKLGRIEEQPISVDDHIELTTKEIHTIEAIGNRKKINVTEVGAHFGVTKGAASQRISRLVERGFVTKAQAAHSSKEFELTLTELGWRAFHAHERFHGQARAELVSRLSELTQTQIDDVASVLDTMEVIMNKRLNEM